MTREEWSSICDEVTNKMVHQVRDFISPLYISGSCPRALEGSGAFVEFGTDNALITCHHVSRGRPLDFSFRGHGSLFELGAPIATEVDPIDVELTSLKTDNWAGVAHSAKAIPRDRFDSCHNPHCKEEILFIHGYAGENAGSGFGEDQPISTGYVTQQIEPGNGVFTLFWRPGNETYSSETDESVRLQHKAMDPHGLSGSLVWDTKRMSCHEAKMEWSPSNARVSGIVSRWDEESGALTCVPIERFRHVLSL